MTEAKYQTKLAAIEDGYAEVRNARGTTVGAVAREKHGSTRTGVRWIARGPSGRIVGYGYTRDEAHNLVDARTKQVAAWKAAQR